MSEKTKKATSVEPPPSGEQEPVSQTFFEYLASSIQHPMLAVDRIIGRESDDIERDFGLEVYDKMVNDPILGGHVDKLKIDVLENGWRIVHSVAKPVGMEIEPGHQSNYDTAEAVREWVEWNFKRLESTQRSEFLEICWDLMDALLYGSRLAEWVMEWVDGGPYPGSECLKAIKIKPRQNYAYVLSNTNDLTGVMAVISGRGYPIRTGIIYEPAKEDNVIAPEKFVILTIGKRENNPIGRSQLRKAYAPWFEKQLLRTERLKYGVQFGGGKITVELGEKTPSTVKWLAADGTEKTISAVTAAQYALQDLSSGKGGVFPFGCKVTHVVPGDAKALREMMLDIDREMVMALCKQVRETMEAEHGSKADSSTSQDVGDKVTNWLRGKLAGAFTGLIKMLVTLKFGDDIAEGFCPRLDFASASTGDFSKNAEAHGKLGYEYHHSQFEGIDDDIGAPKRAKNWREDMKAKEEADRKAKAEALEETNEDSRTSGES